MDLKHGIAHNKLFKKKKQGGSTVQWIVNWTSSKKKKKKNDHNAVSLLRTYSFIVSIHQSQRSFSKEVASKGPKYF